MTPLNITSYIYLINTCKKCNQKFLLVYTVIDPIHLIWAQTHSFQLWIFLLNPLLPLVEVVSFIRNPIFCFSFTIRNIIIILFYVKGKEGRKTNFLIYVEEKQITRERHRTSLHSSGSFSSVLPIFIVFV